MWFRRMFNVIYYLQFLYKLAVYKEIKVTELYLINRHNAYDLM
jgi:hypothetical protein